VERKENNEPSTSSSITLNPALHHKKRKSFNRFNRQPEEKERSGNRHNRRRNSVVRTASQQRRTKTKETRISMSRESTSESSVLTTPRPASLLDHTRTPLAKSVPKMVGKEANHTEAGCASNSIKFNVQNHRVAASDVDFRFGPVGNSGAFFCYPTISSEETDRAIV
jgi:hypothetical protein